MESRLSRDPSPKTSGHPPKTSRAHLVVAAASRGWKAQQQPIGDLLGMDDDNFRAAYNAVMAEYMRRRRVAPLKRTSVQTKRRVSPHSGTEMDSIPSLQNLITIIGTLGGAWVGSRLNRGVEERQWRRNSRLESYTDIVFTCTALAEEADRAFLATYGTPEQDAQMGVVIAKVRDMHRASDKSIFLMSDNMGEHLHALISHCDDLARLSTGDSKPSVDEWRAMRVQKLAEVISAFTRYAKYEIRSTESTSWWKKILHKATTVTARLRVGVKKEETPVGETGVS